MNKWYEILRYKLRDFKIGIQNLIKWFHVIWKDRDWDHFYILVIFKQKLIHTAAYHRKKQRYEGWEYEVERMELCIKLIDYVTEGYYETKFHNYINQKYGNSTSYFTDIPDMPGYSEWNISYENIPSLYTQSEFDNEYKEKSKIARNKQIKAKALLFKVLDKHILHWWD